MKKTVEYAEQKSFDLALISGILNQQKLYQSLGFKPFGPIQAVPQPKNFIK
jgi:hypothetical protein